MKTILLKINRNRPESKKIEVAAKAIRAGKLVVFPTETVYGIGANAFDSEACRRIYKVKNRNVDNPLIIHVSSIEMAEKIAYIPEMYRNVIKRLWPAPITFILKSKKILSEVAVAKLDTIAVRMPAHKVALRLINKAGVPIAAPSANVSTMPSATKAEHALQYFRDKVDVIIDSGPAQNGIESTIIDLRRFALVRAGAFSVEEIAKHFGRMPKITPEALGNKNAKIAISPGTKYKHYAPETPLLLYSGALSRLPYVIMAATEKSKRRFAFVGSVEMCDEIRNKLSARQNKNVRFIALGNRRNLREIAHNLFDRLIFLDSTKVSFAIAESFPQRGVGLAIMNRLRKASGHRYFSDAGQLEAYLKLI